MKNLTRFLAFLLCAVMSVSILPISSLALSYNEGEVCHSRFGAQLVGYDGGKFTHDTMDVMYYRPDGSTYYDTYTSSRPLSKMYLYTQNNVDEQWAYCVEYGVSFASSSNGYTSQNGNNSAYFNRLPASARHGIMLAALYGFQQENSKLPVSGINKDDYYMATQIVMWEYQQQVRTDAGARKDNGPVDKDSFYNIIKGRSAEKAYNYILDKIREHGTIPSFARSDRDDSSMLTHTMKYDAQTKKYSVTLTDESNSGCDLTALNDNTAGITVTRDGNRYTFSTSSIINSPITIGYKKKISMMDKPFLVWGRPGYQTMCTGVEDPIQFYVRLQTEAFGSLSIIKKADSDISVAGWQFHVEGNGVNMDVTVDSQGRFNIPELKPGWVTVSEINVPDYYQKPSSQRVEIIAGQTTEVQFYNRYLKGALKIHKDSEGGKMTAGVQFRVTGVADNGKTYNQIHTVNSSGDLLVDGLYTGSYTVSEVGLPGIGIPSWIAAPASQTVRVNADQTSTVTFYNALKRGSLEIRKQSEDGQFIEGIGVRVYGTADCGEIYDKTFYTDSSGRIFVDGLLEGTYFTQELAETVNPAYYVAATQIVVIEADETTQTQLYNKLKRVPLRIIKESYNGKNLEGIQFLVKGITAVGSEWEHIYTTDKDGIIDVPEDAADAPPAGSYTITELESSANVGYIIPTEKHETFTYGDKVELYFYNAPKTGSIRIIKTDDLGNHFVEGIEFRLQGISLTGDTIDRTAVTSSSGIADFLEVPEGIYSISEEDGVPLFFVRPDPEEVQVVYAQTTEYTVENKAKRTDLHIIKTSTDMENIAGIPFRVIGMPLAGPEFAVDEIYYTDSSGRIDLEGLLEGHYAVYELDCEATIGYVKPGVQEVTLEYGKPATVEFFNKLIENEIRIVKYDGYNNQPLEGFLFGIFSADETELARGRTDQNGELSFFVPYGTGYFIRELEGKTGFLPLESDIPFDVVEDGITQTFPIVNERVPCNISVYKTDTITGEPVPGVTFGLFDESGALVEEATSGPDGYAHFAEPQVWGQKFQVKELSVPEGYLLSQEIVTIEIEPGETEIVIEMENDRAPCRLTIHKTDGTTKEPMPDIEFGLYDQNGDLLQSGLTDQNGDLVFDGLIWGFSYEIRELTEDLPGYYPLEPIPVTVNRGDTEIAIEAVNERIPCEIKVYKTDGVTKLPLSGAVFGLYDQDGNLIEEAASNETGVVSFTPQVWREDKTFSIKEISVPEGYLIADKTEEFTILPGDTLLEFAFKNDREKTEISVYKTDKETNEPLAGVVFGLYDQDGNLIEESTSDETGFAYFTPRIWEEDKTFTIREISVPAGYLLSDTVQEFQINPGDTALEFQYANERQETEMIVYKVDKDTKAPLAGAVFALYDRDGNLIAEAESGPDGIVTFRHIWGSPFEIRELTPPEGYKASDAVISVDLSTFQPSVTYTVENEKIPDNPHTGEQSPWPLFALTFLSGCGMLAAGRIRKTYKKKGR